MADLPHPLGSEVPPGHPAHEWVRRIVGSVERRTGRPSQWNGRLYEEPSYDAQASVRPDHSLTGGPGDVIGPLENASTSRLPPAGHEAFKVRAAVASVTHEAIHLTSEYGDGEAAAEVGEVALDEGLTEAWALANVDAVLTDIGMDRQVPTVGSEHTVDSYPAYTAATGELTRGLSAASGRSPDEVRDHLLNTPRSERWNAAADLVIDGQFGDRVGPEDRAELRKHLIPEMRGGFERLPAVQWGYGLDVEKAAEGRQVGQQAVEGLRATTGRLQAQQHAFPGQPVPPAPERPPMYVTENSGRLVAPAPTPPPVPTGPKPTMAQILAERREKAAAAKGRPSPSEALKALDGQAPASGAVGQPATPQTASDAVRPPVVQLKQEKGRGVD
ncbi:hypothetical protein [Kribbella deserti]|uniref:Uncharacterized protein n=1 Tax=Kribbella deserti TaxID=1926257 RepID=A0ABV6QXN8_9ACTN